jgi:hypothetical protein
VDKLVVVELAMNCKLTVKIVDHVEMNAKMVLLAKMVRVLIQHHVSLILVQHPVQLAVSLVTIITAQILQ